MKLTTARKRFKNQWMAFKIERRNPEIEGIVLRTAKSEDGVIDFIDKKHLNNIYITFNGRMIPRGVGFFF